MKLGKLCIVRDNIRKMIDSKNRYINILLEKELQINNDTVQAIDMSDLEIGLSQLMLLYQKARDIIFLIENTKRKLYLPEVDAYMDVAEKEMDFVFDQIIDLETIRSMVTNSNGDILVTIDSLIAKKYEDLSIYESSINSVLWSTEVVAPQYDSNEDIIHEESILQKQAQAGTPKKKLVEQTEKNEESSIELKEEPSLDGYVDASEYKMNVEISEQLYDNDCRICQSNHRDEIEKVYIDTEHDVMQTLEKASNYPELKTIRPNDIMIHFANHLKYN